MIDFYLFKEMVEKKPQEPFWLSRIFIRHFSIPFSYFCSRLNIRANYVTLISLVLGLMGGIIYYWRTSETLIIGTLLILAWWFLDHVDGELSRYEIKYLNRKPDLSGEYLDLLVHRWVQPLYHIMLGIGLSRAESNYIYTILGITAASNFVGFTRSEAASISLKAVCKKRVPVDNNNVLKVEELARVVENKVNKKGVELFIEIGKQIKTYFAFPGCFVLLIMLTVVDITTPKSSFICLFNLQLNLTTFYLILQSFISVIQNIYGTYYITKILKEIKI